MKVLSSKSLVLFLFASLALVAVSACAVDGTDEGPTRSESDPLLIIRNPLPPAPPPPTTKTLADCDAAHAACAGCTTAVCAAVCNGQYNACVRWVTCSQADFACFARCTTRYCDATPCNAAYATCMGY